MILLSVCANCLPPGSEGFTFVGFDAPLTTGVGSSELGPNKLL